MQEVTGPPSNDPSSSQEVMVVLLESGAHVNALNNAGSTPFFLATEGLHKTPSLVCTHPLFLVSSPTPMLSLLYTHLHTCTYHLTCSVYTSACKHLIVGAVPFYSWSVNICTFCVAVNHTYMYLTHTLIHVHVHAAAVGVGC